jgi:DNA-directed RNA polymerase subunit K|tara:strand:- start:230 stop:433 length:204 start_codon:yes stop_codon:yes gene_type:complete
VWEAGVNLREHSRFEKARVIGARALQISMGAPVQIEVPEEIIDPVIIAQMEYDKKVIPIDIINREKK